MTRSTPEIIISRIGGKARMSGFICDIIEPLDFAVYCEPFCGSCAVFLKLLERGMMKRLRDRRYNPTFVLNDADSSIYNLFKVCREQPEALTESLELTPYSREEHQFCKENPIADDDLENARRFMVRCWQSVSGKNGSSWGRSQNSFYSCRNGSSTNQSSKFTLITARVKNFAQYLKTAYIENLDFEKCIKDWDSEKALFYCDPPYVHSEKYYKDAFTKEDHYRLAETLHSIKGQAVLTYYPHSLVQELYSEKDWLLYKKQSHVSSQVLSKHQQRDRVYKEEWVLVRKRQSAKMFSIPHQQLQLF